MLSPAATAATAGPKVEPREHVSAARSPFLPDLLCRQSTRRGRVDVAPYSTRQIGCDSCGVPAKNAGLLL